MSVSRTAKPSLYIQVQQRVFEHIREHGLEVGQRLPSESELSRDCEVSVGTVRRALAQLQQRGIVCRRQARGTFLERLDFDEQTAEPGVIGVAFVNMNYLNRPTFSAVFRGIEKRAEELGYLLHFYPVGQRYGTPDDRIRPFDELIPLHSIRGLVVFPPVKSTDIQLLQRQEVRFVTLNHYQGTSVNVVHADQAAAGRQGMQYFYDRGRRRIGVIAGTPRRSDEGALLVNHLFIDACRQFAQERGMRMPEDWIQGSNYTRASGYGAAKRMLASGDRPDALLAVDDALALGAVDAIREAGLTLNEDIELLGCSGSPESAPFPRIRFPLMRQGETMIDLLDELLARPQGPRRQKLILPEPDIVPSGLAASEPTAGHAVTTLE